MDTQKRKERLERLKKEGLQVDVEKSKSLPWRDPVRDGKSNRTERRRKYF